MGAAENEGVAEEGGAEGTADGCGVGDAEGLTDGLALGIAVVGANVGSPGPGVGAAVGVAVGVAVGKVLGAARVTLQTATAKLEGPASQRAVPDPEAESFRAIKAYDSRKSMLATVAPRLRSFAILGSDEDVSPVSSIPNKYVKPGSALPIASAMAVLAEDPYWYIS